MQKQYDTIAVDFDGTLCADAFPEIGVPINHVIDFVKSHAKLGSKIILYTCRENGKKRALLDEAVTFCERHGIPLYAVNENPGNPFPKKYGIIPGRKIFADLYIEDKSLTPDKIAILVKWGKI